jgi:peptidoglycan-N-acetylglucosamine deacetylase
MKAAEGQRTVGRRAMLLGIGGVVVGAVLAEGGGVSEAAQPRISTRLPSWAHRWRAPIYDLGDFLRREPRYHFERRSILLTIDDGPSREWTPRYLRLLERHGVVATFNVIGEQVPPNRHLVRAVASEGHVIANHTWTHDERLPYRSARRIHREIARTSEAIHDASGYLPAQFRAPGGVWGPAVFAELARQHMMPVGWDIDPRDWALPGTAAIASAIRKARPGDIVLCHDGGGDRYQTFAALQIVIPELLARGLHFGQLPARNPATA